MNVPVKADHVWLALEFLACFAVFVFTERMLFFLTRLRGLQAKSHNRDKAEFRRIVAASRGDIAAAHRLAAESRARGMRVRLLRCSGGTLDGLTETIEREERAIHRFRWFFREGYGIATSFGLLGTVCGMLEAFAAGALQSGVSKAIADALGTTAVGLLIGLPVTYGCGLVFGRWAVLLEKAMDSVSEAFPPSDASALPTPPCPAPAPIKPKGSGGLLGGKTP